MLIATCITLSNIHVATDIMIRSYLIIGVAVMMLSTLVYMIAGNELVKYETGLGQLGVNLNPEIREQYQMYQTLQTTFAVIGVGGLGLTIYSAVKKDSIKQTV